MSALASNPEVASAVPLTSPPEDPIRIDASAADVRELNRLVRRGVRISNEQFDGDDHLNEVIPKPCTSAAARAPRCTCTPGS
jgi:hypothetical protein